MIAKCKKKWRKGWEILGKKKDEEGKK